jgi:LPXTG-motif cell wall-anchored protein
MPERRRLRYGLISAVAGAACLALATPAWAAGTVSLSQSGVPAVLTAAADPSGANGTVKIDGLAFDDGIDNEPHVTCSFEADFFNFDNDERVNVVFTAQPPTGPGTELLRQNNVLVSDDPAGGGKPDPDNTFTFSVTQLGLGAYEPQPQQGYHVKLTVERIGAPGAGKHKVFWIKPCAASGGNASGAPGSGASGDSGAPTPGSSNGAPTGSGGLPITGAPVGSIALLGAATVAAGAGLLIWRRRRTITG